MNSQHFVPSSLTIARSLRCQGTLVVEDSPLQKANLCNWLRTFGLDNLITSGDGHHALELVRNLPQPPCLMILDLELPGMDGIELLQHLYELQIKPAVIVLSSADDSLLGAVATMVDAMGFRLLGSLQKPLTPLDLYAALEKYQDANNPTADSNGAREPSPEHLRQALVSGAIVPAYQPKVDLQLGCLAGVEALARWQRTDGTSVPPAVFIPLAERSGLIEQLTLAMLDHVLAEMAIWSGRGQPLPMALNLSPTCLSSRDLTNAILQKVSDSRQNPALITFEITESACVLDLPAALASVSRLRLKGFGFSIDDYGTGFSSMQQLARFPFTELKIDRSFVHGAAERESLRAILQSAVDMGRRLGITTVAEGVENRAELQLLRRMGCRQAQGYGFARPMSGKALQEWLGEPLRAALRLCMN